MEFILVEKQGHTAVLTINRPAALNALNSQVLSELAEAVNTVADDDDIYVVVITGSGKAFVAGADIGEMKDLTPLEGKEFGQFGSAVFSMIENLPKPVIAAVNGFALGGGCELAMSCDIRIAGEKAKFGQPETGLGITPGFGGTQRLPRIVGKSMAKELIFTGRTVPAATALEIGLVDRVVSQEELLPTALALAEEIGKNAQVAVRQAKAAINHGMDVDLATGLAFEAEAFGMCFSTEDQLEGMTAFVEKRPHEPYQNK